MMIYKLDIEGDHFNKRVGDLSHMLNCQHGCPICMFTTSFKLIPNEIKYLLVLFLSKRQRRMGLIADKP